ncbi:YgjP-like metallopeptidase domain-containing protein (plasmid) [Streptomyces sp. BI20]|uniref:YgjP-like metallopeptidase domain-containing protein n=1 Tax=Streptomyces sp. BI20 TaxID=3403460 RepID=UPI003C77A881
MTTRTTSLGGQPIHIRTSNRTTTDLTVSPAGDITVRGPHTLTDTDAQDLVSRRREWIYRRLAANATRNGPTLALGTTRNILVLGVAHRLHLAGTALAPSTQPTITIPSFATTNRDKATKILINHLAEAGEEWLKNNAAKLPRRYETIRFSTTGRVHLHTLRQPSLTLNWSLAQLTPLDLHHYIGRIHHRIKPTPELARTLAGLWRGDLTLPPQELPTCPSCGAKPNTLHAAECMISWCAYTGRYRDDCDHPRATCVTLWTGRRPGHAECEEYGLFYLFLGGRFVPCNHDDPGAHPDLNRLRRLCGWSRTEQRMVLSPASDRRHLRQRES